MRAAQVLAELALRGETLGVAESLTGGELTSRLVDVPGASRVLRGAVVCYTSEVKAAVLGVSAELLSDRGAVDPKVAIAMAEGVCRVLASDWGVSTTGVAGPDPADGKAVGTAYVAVVRVGARAQVRELHATGDRAGVRQAVVQAALELLHECVDPEEAC